MSEATPPTDEREERDSGTDRPNDAPDAGTAPDGGVPVPEPADDDVTVELVRDAIGVARGELCDRRFSSKYGTAEEGRNPFPSESSED